MIKAVKVVNFRVLKHVDVVFEQFTVLVGPNGSGKTTLLRAFLALRSDGGDVLKELPGRTIFSSFVDNVTELTVISTGAGSSVLAQGPTKETEVADPLFKSWEIRVNSTEFLQLDGPSLRATSYHQSAGQRIQPTGQDLAAAVADLLLTKRRSVEELTKLLRQIVPGVVEIQAVRDTNNTNAPAYRVAVEFETAGVVDAPHISEGTLMALAILLSVVANAPKILLIDDIDKGLHPAAQAELVEILRGVLKANPDMQIIATTHSPYLLDCFDPSEVRVMTLGEDGFAQCKKLTEHPNFAEWEGALKAGEMWASVGEDWIREPVTP